MAQADAAPAAPPRQPITRTRTRRRSPRLNLFWRTFFLLALLLAGSVLAWLQTWRALELEPRAVQTAEQIASLVSLSRAALVHADPIARVALIKAMADQERVRIQPREPTDRFETYGTDDLSRRIARELARQLGTGTVTARSVNGEGGLWVGFTINGDPNWLRLDAERYSPGAGRTWLVWMLLATGLSLVGAALIARRINRPLKALSFATSRLREGDFASSQLDEGAAASEIREVNIGFNRMAQRLAQVEQERAVMLAGISHDLRTPLARLRLETEMSVADPQAREHMAADIEQLDAIIDKFLDYARPGPMALSPVALDDVVQACARAASAQGELQVQVNIADDIRVLADEVELSRVVANLLENARRYARLPPESCARVDIDAEPLDASDPPAVQVVLRDHGPGVPPEMLPRLVKPFFRADAARTSARGAGLGLAIVEKTVQRMGGRFDLQLAPPDEQGHSGLVARIQLRLA